MHIPSYHAQASIKTAITLRFLRPAPCQEHYLATRWPNTGGTTIFWTQQAGSRQFRVLWGRDKFNGVISMLDLVRYSSHE